MPEVGDSVIMDTAVIDSRGKHVNSMVEKDAKVPNMHGLLLKG